MIIRRTHSVCPLCLKRLPADVTLKDDQYFLEKKCPEHGNFATVIWRGQPELLDWMGNPQEMGTDENPNCPQGCGICADHRQGTCCVLLEVTGRCNLNCRHCFAESSASSSSSDPSLSQVKTWIDDITKSGRAFMQLSGGEPTVRDDLPQIVAHAKSAGCEYVQLNSNGLRLAEDEKCVADLAEAGLSFVFMQFDGTSDEIYLNLRGRKLLEAKMKAIENCGRHNIGVTLVPTLVPGVNSDDIGGIIKLALANSPYVRGVHFQPVSYFGRYPEIPDDRARITLPETLRAIYGQTEGLVPPGSITSSHCDHPRCGFHSAYINLGGRLKPLTKPAENCCCSITPAETNRHYVGRRWKMPEQPKGLNIPMAPRKQIDENDLTSLDGFINAVEEFSFTISAMAFQDAYTLDIERLRQCSLHVYANGALVPFCAHYLTAQTG